MDVIVTKDILGEAEDEGDLSALLVEDGAEVAEGDPIADIETGKAVVQVTAPASGTITFTAEVGDVVSVDDVIATIE